jgi:hypothetical protein
MRIVRTNQQNPGRAFVAHVDSIPLPARVSLSSEAQGLVAGASTATNVPSSVVLKLDASPQA